MSLINVSDLSFAYDGFEPVLENVDFSARYGELVALTGASGEGKTTIIRLILGLVSPLSGEAKLVSRDGEITLSGVHRQVAFRRNTQSFCICAAG